jgi:ribonuclease HIII
MVRYYEKLWKKSDNDLNFSTILTPQIIQSLIRDSIKKVFITIDAICKVSDNCAKHVHNKFWRMWSQNKHHGQIEGQQNP